MQNCKYEAFISYRHVEPDMQVAKALHRQLESYSIPAAIKKSSGKSKVGTIFRDQDELPTSSDLGTGIRNALEDSNWLIVVCSPALPLSKWCMEEIDTFISMGKGDHILTLLIGGEPHESFPKQICFTEVNGQRIEKEPLAADIRNANTNRMLKKLKIEKLRLLAPMLGVKFDDLRQRAKERRRKRIALFASCALFASAVFGGIYAIQYQRAQQALYEVNVTKTSELLSKAQNYYYNGQQASAVRTAAECLALQTSLGLDTLSAQSLLYSSIVNFPEKRNCAALSHAGTVNGAVFSPDGSLLATVSNKDFLTVWNVHTAEVVYAKQLTQLEIAPYYDRPIFELYCLKFTKSNELVMAIPTGAANIADSLSVYKYDRKGNEIFSYDSPDLYHNYRTGMYVWDDAGVIVLNAYEGYLVLDLNDGSVISEKPMSEYAWFESDSSAGKYLTLGYFANSSDTCNLSVDVLTAESVKSGKAYESFSFSVPLDKIDSMIPLDDKNVVISNKDEIYLYNMSSQERKTVGEFSNMGMKFPVLMTCSKPYHFAAGYADYSMAEYAYDPVTGEITLTNDFTYGTNPDCITDFVSWADKGSSIMSFLLKSKGNSGYWVLSDGTYWYRYDVFDSDGVVGWVSSENGTIASIIENSNLCYLYDVTVKSDHYSTDSRYVQDIRQPLYLDSADNFVVYQGFELGKGYYFSIGSLQEGAYAEDKRSYIPGTEAFNEDDMFDVKAPYDQVLYGKNEAVLLVSEGNNEWSLLRLDYAGCTFERLCEFSAEGPELIDITGEVVVVCPSNGTELDAYDLKTGKLVNRSPEGRIYWNNIEHYGRPAQNIAFWAWLDKDAQRLRWCHINFDTGEFINLEELAGGEDSKVFISEDGYTAFLYSPGMDIAVFDLHTGKITGHIKDDNFLDIQYLGGNLLAMVNRQNDVHFYDMGAQKELAVFSGLTDNIRSITYNVKNGLAMIMGNTTLEIFDVENNRRYTGTIMFADRFDIRFSHTAYISDDARWFWLISLEADSDYKTGLWYYCNPTAYRLYSSEELLQLAKHYGYN